MNLLRLLFLVLLVLGVRRVFVSARKAAKERRDRVAARRRAQREAHEKVQSEALGDLTDQGIDDADFEEIP